MVVECSEAFQTFLEGLENENQMCFLEDFADSVGLEVVNQMHPYFGDFWSSPEKEAENQDRNNSLFSNGKKEIIVWVLS